jgi:hypothetical protein
MILEPIDRREGMSSSPWGSSVVEDDGSFAVFGACTLP